MAEVIFSYEGKNTYIKCHTEDNMEEIIQKFLKENSIKDNNKDIHYFYNGNKINYEFTFAEQANELDKKRKKMNIITYNDNQNKNQLHYSKSKGIICPECKENILIDFKDFTINLHGCRHNHFENNIFLYLYGETQKFDLNSLICDICKNDNKSNNHNDEFYICGTCNKNICHTCKLIHDKEHFIINYEEQYFICKKHNKPFIKYCKECNKDICPLCEKKHKEHNILKYKKIFVDKSDLIETKDELNKEMDIFKFKLNIVKQIFDKMVKIMDLYIKLNNDIIDNYNKKNVNYNQLQNLHNLKRNNEKLIKDFKNMNNADKLTELYEYSYINFYNEYGEKYIGELQNGAKQGKGMLYYNIDDEKKRVRYVGDFKNDRRDGRGIIYWKNGSRYEGEWKNDKRKGKGIFHWNGGDRYEGDFKNNKFEGKGIFYWNNGNKYEGDFGNSNMEGKGIFLWNNGDKYEGEFKNGKRDGKGIMYYKNGNVEKGNWKNDKYIGD